MYVPMKQLIRFTLVGGSMTLLYLGLVVVLVEWFGLPPSLAYVCASAISTTLNFVLNKYWTFQVDGKVVREVSAFIVTYVAAAALNISFSSLLYAVGVSYLLASVLSSAIVLFLTFTASRLFVFKSGVQNRELPLRGSCYTRQSMRVCVIGASQGLGRVLCERLLEGGHEVWGVARRGEQLRTLKPSARHAFRWTQADITAGEDRVRIKTEMDAAGFVPDCVVVNAGIQIDDMEESYDHVKGAKVLETNLTGALGCVECFLPPMLARKKGSIVAIASTAAFRPSSRSASYAASKAGLAMAFRAFRLRYANTGIRFAVVYLGPMATQMWEGRRSPLVASVDAAAARIASFLSSNASVLHYPFFSTLLLRLSLVCSDRFFSAATRRLLK